MSKDNNSKPTFSSSDPESFAINISDRSGFKTLLYGSCGLAIILLVVYALIRVLINVSPLFISVQTENKIFKNAHRYAFPNSEHSKILTKFAKQIEPENQFVDVYTIRSESPNAYCFLGNKLFITTELLKSVESENELAFVMAHELGHAKYRHNLKNLSVNMLLGLTFSFVDALQPTSRLLSSNYSRAMESEADSFALSALQKYYGHTKGAETFFTRLNNEKSKFNIRMTDLYLEYLSTHPSTKLRIAKIVSTQKESSDLKIIKRKDSVILNSL